LRSRPGFIVTILCIAETLSMLPFSMFLAVQPLLQDEWRLTNTESGWISSAYFAGYMAAVPLLSSLTDRIDARTVWLGACALSAAAASGFAVSADGVGTAAALQMVAGAGLAGTYMPGLKVMTDRLPQTPRPRHVAFYTTSFTAGASLSFWFVGLLGARLPWQTAVLIAAAGPIAAWILVGTLLRPVSPARSGQVTAATHVRAVFRSGDTIRYVIGYAVHAWELFALRAWIVPFIMFCATFRGSPPPISATTLAAIVSLIGIPASIAGAELTTRVQARRLIVGVMWLSIAVSLTVVPAALAGWPLLMAAICVYSALISADSAALTSGILQVAPAASRGTAMAVYSTLGFAGASAGTFAVGALLDLLGGQSVTSWALAFGLMGAPNAIGALALVRSRHS
jgi:MFS family permease